MKSLNEVFIQRRGNQREERMTLNRKELGLNVCVNGEWNIDSSIIICDVKINGSVSRNKD